MAAGLPEPDGSCWRPWDQATSLQFWHLVVGGRFLPFTLKNVENHSSSVWRGIRGWLTLSRYVQMQMLSNHFPPTLARTGLRTISQCTICHPEPWTLRVLHRPLMGVWCHSVCGNRGKIKFSPFYAALQLLWKPALNIPKFWASLQNIFLIGQNSQPPLPCRAAPGRCRASGTLPITEGRSEKNGPLFLICNKEAPSSRAFIKPCARTVSSKWHFWIIEDNDNRNIKKKTLIETKPHSSRSGRISFSLVATSALS